ncbi:unnamed protein product, partial [Effrenium voratum]
AGAGPGGAAAAAARRGGQAGGEDESHLVFPYRRLNHFHSGDLHVLSLRDELCKRGGRSNHPGAAGCAWVPELLDRCDLLLPCGWMLRGACVPTFPRQRQSPQEFLPHALWLFVPLLLPV